MQLLYILNNWKKCTYNVASKTKSIKTDKTINNKCYMLLLHKLASYKKSPAATIITM